MVPVRYISFNGKNGIILSESALPVLSPAEPVQLNGSQEARFLLLIQINMDFVPPSGKVDFEILKFFATSAC